jgi:pimeloyl-ACP methyl ester carboxylesterase
LIPYADVVDAFKQFIAQESSGGPFVLIGHSQGAGLLGRLIADEIDEEPLLRDRMLSAVLLGTSVASTRFDNVPACSSVGETGCLITYSSYRNTSPPPSNALFGRTASGPALCTNPVGLTAEQTYSEPYFAFSATGMSPFDDPTRNVEITTPWVTYPEMLKVRCVNDGTFGYLEVTVDQVPGPRTDNITGDLTPQWGLHAVDANVAMGDLVDLVAAQATSFG